MSSVSLAVVAKLREELRFVMDETLALASKVRFRRIEDDRRETVATFDPSLQQAAHARALNDRFQRWLGITKSLLLRYALTPAIDLDHEVERAAVYVLLQRRTCADIPEGVWRADFARELTRIRLQLEQVMEVCENSIPSSTRRAVYEPIDLYVDSVNDRDCRVTLRAGNAETRTTLPLPFTLAEMNALIDFCGKGKASEQSLEQFGRKLFSFFMEGAVGDLYSTVSRQIDGQGARRWIRLHLENAGFLASAPWELLHDGVEFLAVQPAIAISRCLTPALESPPAGETALRLLVTISSPNDLHALRVNDEKQLLRNALGGLELIGRARVDIAPDGTLDTLRRMLRAAEEAGRPYNAWHFIGHGSSNDAAGRNELAMTGRDGNAQFVDATQLRVLFSGQSLRFAVLNACETGAGGVDTSRGSLAGALMDRGAQAVVAMQFSISDGGAILLAGEIYEAMAADAGVLNAVTDVRRALFCRPPDVEWMTPILVLSQSS